MVAVKFSAAGDTVSVWGPAVLMVRETCSVAKATPKETETASENVPVLRGVPE